jgi:hypothetical protein
MSEHVFSEETRSLFSRCPKESRLFYEPHKKPRKKHPLRRKALAVGAGFLVAGAVGAAVPGRGFC